MFKLQFELVPELTTPTDQELKVTDNLKVKITSRMRKVKFFAKITICFDNTAMSASIIQ